MSKQAAPSMVPERAPVNDCQPSTKILTRGAAYNRLAGRRAELSLTMRHAAGMVSRRRTLNC